MANQITNPKFINSLDVKVFPSTLRSTYDPSARLTTEYNLCSLINRLVNQESFIISSNINDKVFYFNIHGYIVSVNSSDVSKSAFDVIKEKTNLTPPNTGFEVGSIIYAHMFIKYDYSPGIDQVIADPTKYEQTWSQLQGSDGKKNAEGTGIQVLNSGDNAELAIYTGLWLTDSSDSIVFDGWDIVADSTHYALPLFRAYGNDGENLLWEIYPDSQIKFKTGVENLGLIGGVTQYKHHRSVVIDDGVL